MTDNVKASGSRRDAESEAVLRRVLRALGPYRDDVILIGGWVPYLYQRFGDFSDWRAEIARTTELDLVIPSELDAGPRPLLATILTDAGFTASKGTQGALWVGERPEDEIEFFTPHQGTARQIGRPRIISGQTSIAAVALLQLPLLVEETRTLTIGTARTNPLTVRVPTLGAYVLNKALTFTARLSASDGGIAKAAKDIVYMRDVTAGGEDVRVAVGNDIKSLMKTDKSRKSLLEAAHRGVHGLTVGRGRVLDAAVEQLEINHRFSSEGAARADLIGNMEILSNLLAEIQPVGRHRYPEI